jgi:hypothetical protein
MLFVIDVVAGEPGTTLAIGRASEIGNDFNMGHGGNNACSEVLGTTAGAGGSGTYVDQVTIAAFNIFSQGHSTMIKGTSSRGEYSGLLFTIDRL